MSAMRILATLFLSVLLCLTASGQDEVVTGYDCECFIDGVSFKQGTLPANGGKASWQIDAAALPPGMHHVQMRIVQHLSSGISVTAAHDALCYRMGEATNHEVTATCRVDGKVYKSATVPTNGAWTTWTLDLKEIPEGLHHVNVMIADKDRDGMVSTTAFDAMCYRPVDGASHEVTATCYVDGLLSKQSTLTTDGGTLTWTLDWSDLPVGLHKVRVDIADKDKEGIVRMSRYQAMCYRAGTASDHEVTASFYVEGKLVKQESINCDGEPQTCWLNLSNLPEGTYQIKVEVADTDNQGIVTVSVFESEFYCLGFEIYDLNGDGSINIGDVSILIDAILGDGYNEDYDINGDGQVNITDINLLIAYILSN